MSEVEGGGTPEQEAEAHEFNRMVDEGELTRIEAANIEKNKTPQEVKNEKTDELIQGIESYGWETNHSALFSQMYFLNRECQELVNDRLVGKRLIDLGSGESGSLWVPAVAAFAGASEYVGVEKYHHPVFGYEKPDGSNSWVVDSREIPNGRNVVGNTLRQYFGEGLQDIDIKFVREDGLKFLTKQDNNSGSIVINGVDEDVIPPWRARNRQYLKRMVEEIDRVVGPNGVVMSYNAPFLSGLLDKGFEVREFEKGKLKVYMKKDNGKSDESK